MYIAGLDPADFCECEHNFNFRQIKFKVLEALNHKRIPNFSINRVEEVLFNPHFLIMCDVCKKPQLGIYICQKMSE